MFKGLIRPADSKPIIILGLSDENAKRLKENKPIMFDGSQLGLDGYRFVITCKSADGQYMLPKSIRPGDPSSGAFLVVALEAADLIRCGTGTIVVRDIESDDIPWRIMVARGATEDAMMADNRELITAHTKVTMDEDTKRRYFGSN